MPSNPMDAAPFQGEAPVSSNPMDAAPPWQSPIMPILSGAAGVGEAALSGVTGGAGSLADTLGLGSRFPYIATGSNQPGSHDWAYQPRTEAGQAINRGIGTAMSAAGNTIYDQIIGPGIVSYFGGNQDAMKQTLAERVPQAIGSVGTVLTAASLAKMIGGAGQRFSSSFEPEPTPQSFEPHPLQGIADNEASRFSASADAMNKQGFDLPPRNPPPHVLAANRVAQVDLNLPTETSEGLPAPLTKAVTKAGRQLNAGPTYEALKKVPAFDPGQDFTNQVMNNVDLTQIPEKLQPPIDGSLTGARAVDLYKDLTNRAHRYFSAAKVPGANPDFLDMAWAHQGAADAIRDAMTKNLMATGQTDLASAWGKAATYTAKSYDVDAALDGAGNVVVPKLVGQMRRGVPLSGGIQQLADAGAMYPDLFKNTPMRPAPSLAAKATAKVLPTMGAGIGGFFAGGWGAAAGATLGQSASERILQR